MNILVLSWRDPKHPLAGGAEQVMHEHMKGWVEKGHKVTLFSSKILGLVNSETLDGVNIVRGGYQYLGVQIAAFFYYLKNGNDFDLIVDQFHGLPFFTPFYSSKPKIAVIQEPAREVWLTNPLPLPMNWIVGLIGYLGEPFIFLFYKNVPFMTGSESARRELIKLGIPEKNITVVPHGVLVPRKVITGQKIEPPAITFLGILSKDKGVEDAIRCFALLNKKGDYTFWIIGKAETEGYMRRLKSLVVKLDLKEKVKFWGFVSQQKKFELLAKSWVMVNPSIREGWGLVNIEANFAGTPVVAYNSLGLTDSVRDGQSGIIVKSNTPQDLANTIKHILSDDSLYRKLVSGAISWSKNFTWNYSRGKSLSLVESLSNSSAIS